MKGPGAILALCAVAAAVVVFITFGTAAMGSVDENVNFTGNSTEYEESYNATSDAAKLTFSSLSLVMIFSVVGALIIAAVFILRS